MFYLDREIILKIEKKKFVYCGNLQYLCKSRIHAKMKLTEKEEELIIAIRNFREAQHNPSWELEWYARRIFEELLDGDDDEARKALLKKERSKKKNNN